ncbi:MAG: Fn3-like domain-containing protein [Bacteroidales bacterium]
MSSKLVLPFRSLLFISKRCFRISSVCILIVCTYILPFDAISQGNLLVTPRRVVFEGKKKSIDLNLANTGQDTATYAISMVQIRMNEDGSFGETITEPDPGQNFADKNIRYFPRSVTLPPNEAQVVKVQLSKANELEPGEYRSHFYFRSIPKVVALGEEEAEVDTTSISVRLVPVFGITIPAIIRIGQSNTKVTISDLTLEIKEDSTPTLSLNFNREGNFSVYGDLTVDYVASNGTVTRVGMANGIAVYTPNLVRHFQFDLNKLPGVDYNSGKLLVDFSASSDVEPEKFAEAELRLD